MERKIIKKYIRRIKRIYRGKYKDKKQFIRELQDALLCFCEEHPNSSYSDLIKEFGKPSEIKSMLSFHGAEKLQKRNMFLYWAVNIVIIMAVTILLLFTVHYVINKYNFAQGYYIEYFDDNKNNINPLTGETNPPPDSHIDFD